MGAWGTGVFDNDTACDWVGELVESSDLSRIETTLDNVLQAGSGYLEAPEAEEALAAAEVVARLQGNWGVRDVYTAPVDEWVEENNLVPTEDLVQKAIRAIDRILAPSSELLELWEETGDDLEAWKASLDDLRSRVQS